MASNLQVLHALSNKPGPVSCEALAKGMGLKANEIATPLRRMAEKEPPFVIKNADEQWSITDHGEKMVLEANAEEARHAEAIRKSAVAIEDGAQKVTIEVKVEVHYGK
jgi:predicted transcriptional regulator